MSIDCLGEGVGGGKGAGGGELDIQQLDKFPAKKHQT